MRKEIDKDLGEALLSGAKPTPPKPTNGISNNMTYSGHKSDVLYIAVCSCELTGGRVSCPVHGDVPTYSITITPEEVFKAQTHEDICDFADKSCLVEKGIKLRNSTDYEFIDISSEEWREYNFKEEEDVFIENPMYIAVSKSGHRILDAEGICHFIPNEWIHIRWKAKEGQPHFVK